MSRGAVRCGLLALCLALATPASARDAPPVAIELRDGA